MDYNSNNPRPPPFLCRPESSLSFLYSHNYDLLCPGLEVKYPVVAAQASQGVVGGMGKNCNNFNININQLTMEKKKRLTSEQLDSLESSFQEEIKLDPDRKMKLARELGLQPRQVAVWFQNRRARWKAKQLERLYDSLKLEFDAVSREKQKLQDEVVALKAMLKEQATKNNQVSTAGYTEISGEETVESTSVVVANRSSSRPGGTIQQQMAEGNYVFNVEDYNPVMPPPYWGTVLPSYP